MRWRIEWFTGNGAGVCKDADLHCLHPRAHSVWDLCIQDDPLELSQLNHGLGICLIKESLGRSHSVGRWWKCHSCGWEQILVSSSLQPWAAVIQSSRVWALTRWSCSRISLGKGYSLVCKEVQLITKALSTLPANTPLLPRCALLCLLCGLAKAHQHSPNATNLLSLHWMFTQCWLAAKVSCSLYTTKTAHLSVISLCNKGWVMASVTHSAHIWLHLHASLVYDEGQHISEALLTLHTS